MRIIQEGQFDIFWRNYIYETFANITYTKREVFKRKRDLILQLPIDKELLAEEIVMLTPLIAKKYSNLTMPTLKRDLKTLADINLIKKTGKKYKANTDVLKAMIPQNKTG